jgi:hypothetical protein
VIDSPLWRIAARQPWARAADAAAVREQLKTIPDGASVLSLPNLIPHLRIARASKRSAES